MSNQDLTNEIATRQNFNRIVGFWNLLPDPDPILRKIGKDITCYRELMTDSHLSSTIEQRKAGTLSLERELNRGNSSQLEYDVLSSFFDDLDLENIINQILNAPLFGFTIFELVWEQVGRFLLPTRIEEKPQEWFFFDNDNQLKLRKNVISSQIQGAPLNPLKFLLVQHKPTYMNPYGERILSRCFWPVTFKRGGLKFWVTFTEKYGMPFLHGKLPRGASQADIDALARSLEDMIQDAIAVTPEDSSIEIKEAGKTSSADIYEKFLNFQNSEISKAILTQTLTTEVQDKGTYAASETMSNMLDKVQASDKKLVQKMFKQLINKIYEVNFTSTDKPVFILYKEEDVDLNLAQRDSILKQCGVQFRKNYYIRNYNLQEEDFDIVENQMPTFAEQDPEAKAKPVDETVNQIPDRALQMQIEQTLSPVISMIRESKNFDEVITKLAEIFPNLKSSQLDLLLSKLIFISEIQGRLDA
ncbi:MAG TPA: DUF935 family protein [Bacteroidota bacterium]|nr:DUF935 family protein [Bacteroidota bacterium]